MTAETQAVDVLIVGSGPVGSTFARRITDLHPQARILMVDAGPQLTGTPGVHIQNIADEEERARAQRRSEGPASAHGSPDRSQDDQAAAAPVPGLFLVHQETAAEPGHGGMPIAAMSCNVGGMGAHWACVCPFPGGRERISFIADEEWADLLAIGRRLLAVSVQPADTPAWASVLGVLRELFDADLPAGRKVQPMPMAQRIDEAGGRYLTGTDVILGDLAINPPPAFRLAAETICRKLLVQNGRVRGARLEHLPTKRAIQIEAQVVIVAADSLRTPQLLWASGIRPRALGHYLNDHAMLGSSGMRLTIDPAPELASIPAKGEPRFGWIPYADDKHPFHGQFVHVEIPQPTEQASDARLEILMLGYYLPKDIRFEDRIRFAEDQVDPFGMPAMAFDYELTPHDLEAIDQARGNLEKMAAAFSDGWSDFTPPTLMPLGQSLHYMGTVRMGEHDDGRSVCDSHSRVWGIDNLFVGGNGVIPAPTACNPTLTSVSLAVRAAGKVVELLTAGPG